MAVIEELIRLEDNGSISFGNYLMDEKKKVLDFEVAGNLYKVKTYKDITKLEKNGKMLLETVPGATIHNFDMGAKNIECSVESDDDVQITMELEPEKDYKLLVDDVLVGKISSNIGGKVNFSVELNNNCSAVKIEKL